MPLTRHAPVRPYQAKRINAGSAVEIPYQSTDDELNAVELSELEYRIDNITDSVQIQDWASVDDPGSRGTITIPASTNAMSRDYRDKQLNQVLLKMTDTDGNVRQVAEYYELSALFTGVT